MEIRLASELPRSGIHHAMARPDTLIVALTTIPALASAVTIDEVVKMSKAGVSDAVILEMIARDQTLVTVTPGGIVALRRQGISDAAIVASLKSGMPA